MNTIKNIYTLGFVFLWFCWVVGVGRGCDPLRQMSNAFLYTTKSWKYTIILN